MFEFKTAKAKCLLSRCSVQYHGWFDVPGIDCTSMLIVRTWFPNSFLRMLVCCLIWLQMFRCLGTQGEIRERKSAVVLAQWHFSELQHHIPDGNTYSKHDFFRDTKENVTLLLLQLSLSPYSCYPMLQKCCVSLVLEPGRNCRHSVFLKKAQPWLSVLDVYESAGANWKHTTVGREIATGEADTAGLPVRNDLGLRWKGKAAKGGCKTFEGEKLKIQSFRSAVSIIRE